jgi:predicted tellurium resistance membrane protein TerC
MSTDAEPALVRFAKRNPRFFLVMLAMVVVVGGFFMVRDLTHAIVTYDKANLLKFAFLFAVTIFGALHSRQRYVRNAKERDRKLG